MWCLPPCYDTARRSSPNPAPWYWASKLPGTIRTKFLFFINYPFSSILFNNTKQNKTLISCNNFLVDPFGFSIYKIISSANRISYFFLSNMSAPYLFYFPNFLTRISSVMLNRSNESRHPCLIHDLEFERKAFGFSPLNMIFVVGFYRYSFFSGGNSILVLIYWVFLS